MAIFKTSQIYADNDADEDNETKPNKKAETTNIATLFTLHLRIMKILGLYAIPSTKRRSIYILHVVYCIIVQVIGFLNAFRLMYALTDSKGVKEYRIGIVSFGWTYMLTSYIGVICFVSSKHTTLFLKTINEYQFNYEIHFNLKKVKIIVNSITIFCIFEVFTANVIVSLSFALNWIDMTSLYAVNFWPLQTSTGITKIIACIVYGIVTIYPVAISITMILFYFFVSSAIKREFQNISHRLEKLNDEIPSRIIADLEDIRQQHQAIVNVLSSINPILRHVAGGVYAMGIPVICMMLYGVASKSLLWEDVLKMIASIVLTLIGMFAITFKGASLNCAAYRSSHVHYISLSWRFFMKNVFFTDNVHIYSALYTTSIVWLIYYVAHEPFEYINNFDLSILPEKTLNQIAVFANRLTGPPIGVSVYGLFVVDYSSVLMIFGTIITYAVIAVQFTSVQTECEGAVYNTTNMTFL